VALGNLYVRANRAEFARGFYDQALNLDPQNVNAQAAIARLEAQAKTSANGG
jgi:cytochrome c-type biogenesis protein CcmH/NrfG